MADKFQRALAALKGRDDVAALAKLPFHLRATYGGNTSCVAADCTGGSLIFDAGSGLRQLGERLISQTPRTHHILLSHTHWDHIMGLPFFAPLYEAGHRVVIYGCHPDLQARIAVQFATSHFPVQFSQISEGLSFVQIKPGREVDIGGFLVTPFAQRHPGASYGYRAEAGGRTLVYSTDSEHKVLDDRILAFIDFCGGADILVFDAMYPFADSVTEKAGWGHSSNIAGIEIAKRAGVRHLCLFHHDPDLDDEALDARLSESLRYRDTYRPDVPLALSMAYDGLEIDLGE